MIRILVGLFILWEPSTPRSRTLCLGRVPRARNDALAERSFHSFLESIPVNRFASIWIVACLKQTFCAPVGRTGIKFQLVVSCLSEFWVVRHPSASKSSLYPGASKVLPLSHLRRPASQKNRAPRNLQTTPPKESIDRHRRETRPSQHRSGSLPSSPETSKPRISRNSRIAWKISKQSRREEASKIRSREIRTKELHNKFHRRAF